MPNYILYHWFISCIAIFATFPDQFAELSKLYQSCNRDRSSVDAYNKFVYECMQHLLMSTHQ